MDSRDLKVFSAVYEAKSISRAAKELFLSPQGCSKIIQKIEGELDTALFARSHYGVNPTPQGDALYRKASAVIDILDSIEADIDQVKSEKYTLNVASTQGILAYLTMMFIRDFRQSFSYISPRIIESPDITAKNRMAANEAELGILGGPIDLSIYHALPFSKHVPCLVINSNHPLAQKDKIAFRDLDLQPLALVGREFASYHLVVNRLRNEGVNLDIVMEATELDYCHRLAEENEGIAVSFDFAAWANPRANTVIRRFEDDSFVWETFLVYKEGTDLSPQARDFCRFATEWVENHADYLFRWPEV